MVYVLQGLVDASKEISRLEAKRERLNGHLKKLREGMEIPDYADKVQHWSQYHVVTKLQFPVMLYSSIFK